MNDGDMNDGDMNDYDKSKSQLIAELCALRTQLAECGAAVTKETCGAAPGESMSAVGLLRAKTGLSINQARQSEHSVTAQLAADLKNCEARLNEVQHVAKLGYYSFDIVMDRNECSAALLEIFGISQDYPSDLASWLDLIHPDHREEMRNYLIHNVFEKQEAFDHEYKIIHRKTGEVRWMHGLGRLRTNEDGKPIELFGTIQDITARKQVEEALRISEETYRALIDGMNESAWVIGFDGKFVDVNRTAVQMLQYSRAELLTMGPKDIDAHLSQASIQELMQTMKRERVHILESTHVRKDGLHIPVEIQSTVVTYQGKDVILSIARDVTERKKAEAALQKSEETNRLFAAVVTQANDSIVITDLNGMIEYVNPAYEMMTGYTADEVLGEPLSILQQQDPTTDAVRYPLDVMQQHKTWAGRFLDQHKDGSPYHKDAIIFPIQDVKGNVINYCKIARDISHELELERQLSQAQRLETIGTLAGGIAHDFNNILTPIMGYAEMAAATLAATDPLASKITQILSGAARARDLVEQILTFSRQHEQKRCPLYLHLLINEALKLMRPSIPTTIEIRQSIDSSCGKVLADATQLHQVIVNLCTNAFHAMETSGGLLTIALEEVDVDWTIAEVYPNLQNQRCARLTVSDNGIGMDDATLERIFEPFFTTKDVDRGTGLGLSVAHGIVRSHEGALVAYSTPGEGSSFVIYLPIFVDDSDLETEHGDALPHGTERILLVDDEPAVIDVMQMMLEWLGYEVDICNSSVEALHVVQQQPALYDLVVSDLTMPGMTGVELAAKLREVRRELPIIIVTGYGNALDEETGKAHGIQHVAGKPIVMEELARLLRQALDR